MPALYFNYILLKILIYKYYLSIFPVGKDSLNDGPLFALKQNYINYSEYLISWALELSNDPIFVCISSFIEVGLPILMCFTSLITRSGH